MEEIKKILDEVVETLSSVNGVQAIVLGGSRARGTDTVDSDIDIGIYYDADKLDIPALNVAASKMDDTHGEDLIALPGEWGEWVNAGGWLMIDNYHVDFILRDMNRVETIVKESQEGIVTPHYQTGHPHAYMSVMYRGELAISKILWDANGRVSELQKVAMDYPFDLKVKLIESFIFEARFSYMFIENNVNRDDIYYVTAHIVRVISALNQVLFALNEEYCLNEKKAVRMIETFPIKPVRYKDKVDEIFRDVGMNVNNASLRLKKLIDEVTLLF